MTADMRTLIFQNLINGVPMAQVCRDFQKGEEEVLRIFHFILRKIKSYCFARSLQKTNTMPIMPAGTLEEAKKYRLTCLTVLPKLNLDKDPLYKDVQTEVVTPDNFSAVTRNLGR